MWNQNGRTLYITYEYTVLRDALPPVPPPPLYTGAEGSMEEGGSHHNITDHQEDLQPTGPQEPPETNEVYEETATIDCDQDSAAGPKYTGERLS